MNSLSTDWKEENARLQNRLSAIELRIKVNNENKVNNEKLATIDSLLNNRIATNQSTINRIDIFLQTVSKHLER
jgi:hypothetical protein